MGLYWGFAAVADLMGQLLLRIPSPSLGSERKAVMETDFILL